MCVCVRDWHGAGFTHGPAVPRGAVTCIFMRCGRGPIILIAGRVRAPALSVTAGMYSIYAVQCFILLSIL